MKLPTSLKTLWITAVFIVLFASNGLAQYKQFNVLLFTRTVGFHHESILAGVTAMKEMSEQHVFGLEWHEDPAKFTDDYLEKFDVIVFLNTTGDVFNESQQNALKKFIQSGKGFVGIHSASDTEYDWPWYTKMIGRMFRIHPQIQTAMIDVVDNNFPGLDRMPARRMWTDEWYEFGETLSDDLITLITLDEKSFDPYVKWGPKEGKGMGDFHPIAWYHPYDGGRAFYTGLGHVPATFNDIVFREHIYGGIYWAATGKGIKK